MVTAFLYVGGVPVATREVGKPICGFSVLSAYMLGLLEIFRYGKACLTRC